tara:strand:+ start:483 stop:872 length:390 start_codon:yes stop_codon:yes gene_type:complete
MKDYHNPFQKQLSEIVGTSIDIIESKKSLSQKEQNNFCNIIDNWDKAWDRGQKLFEENGIDLGDYDSTFYRMIEDLFILHFGSKAEIIFWWVYERHTEDGNIAILITEEGKEHILKTPLQLYKFIKKLK